jgi:MFS family permease
MIHRTQYQYRMYSFDQRMASVVNHTGLKGWFVSILELGAWFGVLVTGYLADRFSRKYTILLGNNIFKCCHWSTDFNYILKSAVIVFMIGVIVQTAAYKPASIFAGEGTETRFLC